MSYISNLSGFIVSTDLLIGFMIYLIIFSYQRIGYKKSGDFIMWGMIFCVIGSIFLVLENIFAIKTIPNAYQGVLMIISTYFYVTGFICFHIFIERNKSEINLGLNAALFSFIGLAGGTYTAFALNPIVENFILPLIGYSFFGIVAFSNAAFVTWKIYITTGREIEPLIQTIALLVIVLGFFIGFLTSLGLIPGNLGNILQFTGLMLYLMPYIKNIKGLYENKFPSSKKFLTLPERRN